MCKASIEAFLTLFSLCCHYMFSLYNYFILILNLIIIRFVFKYIFIINWLILLSNDFVRYFFIFIDLYFKNLQILIYQYLGPFPRQVIILLFSKSALKSILARRYFQAFQRFLVSWIIIIILYINLYKNPESLLKSNIS